MQLNWLCVKTSILWLLKRKISFLLMILQDFLLQYAQAVKETARENENMGGTVDNHSHAHPRFKIDLAASTYLRKSARCSSTASTSVFSSSR